jgi:phytoene desaturase
MKSKRVAIIGAGFGGLSAACYLAKAGLEVHVYEKLSQVGGRAHVAHDKGYKFELGPSWYMIPDMYEQVFTDNGAKALDYYALTRLDPSYKVFGPEESYDVGDTENFIRMCASIDPASEIPLRKYLAKAQSIYERIRPEVLVQGYSSKKELLHKDLRGYALQPSLALPLQRLLDKVTANADLQHILAFMTVFLGGSPKNIPGIYSLLNHVDMGLGIWYPEGGFERVVESYRELAEKHGAVFHLNSEVSSLRVANGSVQGIIVDKEPIDFDYVVNNADYHYFDRYLTPPNYRLMTEKKWDKKTLAPSGYMITLGLSKQIPELAHHNLFLDVDWDKHFSDVYDKKVWSESPQFYVCAPSKTDKTVAPKNCENLFILAPMAVSLAPTEAQKKALMENIIQRIEKRIGYQITSSIMTKKIYTTDYFTDTFHAYKGTAFGLAHTLTQSVALRPPVVHPKIKGVYSAGQFTNPGTGVPLVLLSGKIAARELLTRMEPVKI